MTRSKRKRNQNAVYWRERETEAIRHRIKDEQEYFKEVKRIFDNASVNIDKEIKAFYMRYASKEGITLAEAKKRASQMDIEAFSNKAKRYVKTKDFSDQANEELRLYNLTMKVNRLELLKANIGLELVDAYQDLEDITRKAMTERTREELKRQSGILGESINDSRKAVEDIIGQSFYNATFSDRIWHNQTLLKSQLDTLISTGLIQGRNPKALAGELQKVFGTSRYNAERLLITELARVQTQSQQNAYEQCGYDEYQFITIGAGACPICRHMDGRTFKVRDMMVGENAPPLHPNCRCSTSASTEDKVLSKNVELPQELLESNQIDDTLKKGISKALERIEKNYNITIDNIEFAPFNNEGAPFTYVPYSQDGIYKAKLNINSSFNWNKDIESFNARIYNNYINHNLACRNLDDLILHEAAHFKTFEDCKTWSEFLQLEKEVRKKFIPGVSNYNDGSLDGAETIAEGVVAIKNGDKVSQQIANLVKEYTGW